MVEVSLEDFQRLVADALDEIPEPFASHLSNVEVIVEDEPAAEILEDADIGPGGTLFGLYQGIPQTERTANYTWVMPDKITIFRGPITRACKTRNDAREQVAVTVIHEIAHHFGISDERLDELGW